MKKLILTAALVGATALSGFSQGQITFQNTSGSLFYFNDTTVAGNAVTTGTIASQAAANSPSTGVVDVGLYWSTAAFTDAATATLGQIDTMASTGAGYIAGGTIAIGAASGTQVYVQVFAWDATYATPDAAIAAGAYFGAGSAGTGNTVYGHIGAAYHTGVLTASPAPGVPVFGIAAGQFRKTALLQGPEPTTIAIGGLGAAALLMLRRKK